MEPYTMVIGVLAVFMVLAFLITRVDGLAFLAPRSTLRLQPSAQAFCTDRCREQGNCPLTGSEQAAANCPLFKYVGADTPTVLYGSPFAK